MMSVTCPDCGNSYATSYKTMGHLDECPKCHSRFHVVVPLPVRFRCPSCTNMLSWPYHFSNRIDICSACGKTVAIPSEPSSWLMCAFDMIAEKRRVEPYDDSVVQPLISKMLDPEQRLERTDTILMLAEIGDKRIAGALEKTLEIVNPGYLEGADNLFAAARLLVELDEAGPAIPTLISIPTRIASIMGSGGHFGTAVVSTLIDLLLTKPQTVSRKDLEDLSRLRDMVQLYEDGTTEAWRIHSIDCSQIQHLAAEELKQRR